MSVAFILIAALMSVVALACLLVPMLRHADNHSPIRLAIILAVALPLGALGLYAWIGTPAALQPAAAASSSPQMDLGTAVADLRARLQSSPDDAEGWMLLGRAYGAMQRNDEALAALGKALKLKPNDADIMVAYAQADSLNRPDHRIEGHARALLQKALQADPSNQRGLWLIGISDYQRGDYAQASKSWSTLLPLLPPQSDVAKAVTAQIARAEKAMSGTPASAGSVAKTTPAATVRASIEVHVSLAPALRAKVTDNDTVFVFARAIDGPPMPLAVARLHASDLPATVTLTDAMAMTPQLKLSMFPEVKVSARLSKSGNAMPHSGDLQSAATDVTVGSNAQVTVSINQSVP